jgi:hypothetical protein
MDTLHRRRRASQSAQVMWMVMEADGMLWSPVARTFNRYPKTSKGIVSES